LSNGECWQPTFGLSYSFICTLKLISKMSIPILIKFDGRWQVRNVGANSLLPLPSTFRARVPYLSATICTSWNVI
jgi:hypothetical protein